MTERKCRRALGVAAILLAGLTATAVHAYEVGTAPGEFSVDATGTANYRIPIEVPPGVAGMQPDLALLYSSRAGNGQLGVGWSISGLSAVTRCPKTIAQEGSAGTVTYTSADRFCLDGQKLKRYSGTYGASGAQYRTEVESFQRITSYNTAGNGPQRFQVYDKAGLIRDYGNTQGFIEVRGSDSSAMNATAALWAVNKISDRRGNRIEFQYGEDATYGEYWPYVITYRNRSGSQLGKVVFHYDTSRPDKTYGYGLRGQRRSLTRRLYRIDVYGRVNVVRRYYLTYETGPNNGLSHLKTVKQCNADATKCLPPTTFDWQHGIKGVESQGVTTFPAVSNQKFMDVDGDGRVDAVNATGGYVWVWHANSTTRVRSLVSNSDEPFQYAVVTDYNGDGRQDLLVPKISTGRWVLYKSTGNASTPFQHVTLSLNHLNAYDDYPAAIDIDGDAIAELFFKHDNALKFYRSSGAGLSTTVHNTGLYIARQQKMMPIEFDGDGQPELYVTEEGCSYDDGGGGGGGGPIFIPDVVVGDQPSSFGGDESSGLGGIQSDAGDDTTPPLQLADFAGTNALSQTSTNNCERTAGPLAWTGSTLTYMNNRSGMGGPNSFEKPVFLDINGDGLTDVGVLDVGADDWHVYLNQGQGWSQIYAGFSAWAWDKVIVFDYDMDGNADLLIPGSGNVFYAVKYKGTAVQVQNTGIYMGKQAYTVMDWSGDGLADIFFLGNVNVDWHRQLHKGTKPGLMTRIRNGLGEETRIAYASIADYAYTNELYLGTSSGGATVSDGGVRHFRGPVYVVDTITNDTGTYDGSAKLQVATSYKYRGAKLDQKGRGFLGFHEVRSVNLNTQIETVNLHSQTFPYTGMVLSAEQKIPDSTVTEVSESQILSYLGAGCRDDQGGYVDPDYCDRDPGAISGTSVTTVVGKTISNTVNTLAAHTLGTGDTTRWFPYVSDSWEYTYKYDTTTMLKKVRTTSWYTTWGNPTRILVRTYNGSGGEYHYIDTNNTYQDWSDSRWCLSRLMSTTVHHHNYRYQTANTGPNVVTRQSSFTYDPTYCQLTSETIEPNNAAYKLYTAYGFDAYGNRTSETRSGGSGQRAIATRTTSTEYDSLGQYVNRVINAKGHTESYTWNTDLGVKLTSTGPNGLTTSWQYDAFGREIKETAPRTTVYRDTARSWCSTGGCRGGVRSAFRIVTTGSDGSYAAVEYDLLGREVMNYKKGFDGTLIDQYRHYDSVGRAYAVSVPRFAGAPGGVCWNVKTFDGLGRVKSEWSAAEQTQCTGSSPPPAGTEASAGMRLTTYDYDGFSTTSVDPTGRTVERVTNVVGRLRHLREWDNTTEIRTDYDYDATGNITYVKDGNGNAFHMTYDIRGHKSSMTDPDMGAWSYVHDVLGQLVSQTDAKGQTVVQSYDTLGRIDARTEAEGTSTWTYDTPVWGNHCAYAVGKLTEMAGPDGFKEQYCYRDTSSFYGQLYFKRWSIDGRWNYETSYYDAQGRLAYRYSPSAHASSNATEYRLRVDHYYNGYGYHYLSRERQTDGSNAIGVEYYRVRGIDALGNVSATTLGSNLYTEALFDAATGHLTNLTAGSTTTSANRQDLIFDWDPVGNLLERTDNLSAHTEYFSYDDLHRLKTVNFTGSTGSLPAVNHSYDKIGNLTQKGSYSAYTYDPAHKHAAKTVNAAGTSRSYSYDANGNMLSAAGATAYTAVTWTSYNKPRRISKGSYTYSEFTYGPSRARYKQVSRKDSSSPIVTTVYWGDSFERITRSNSATAENMFYVKTPGGRTVAKVKTYGEGITNRETRYLLRDHQGSVTAEIKEDGDFVRDAANVPIRWGYDAWGKRRNVGSFNAPGAGSFLSASFQRGYTGHEHLDHLGLIHMNGRIYDPELGRFLSADPFVQFPESTQGFNRYAYAGNNPLSYSDPSGFFIKKLMKAASIALNFVPGFQGWNAPLMKALINGFLSSGGDLRATMSGIVGSFVPLGHIGQLAYGGALAKAQGGSFADGVKGTAVGRLKGMGKNFLLTRAQRITARTRRQTEADTGDEVAQAAGVAATSTENASESNAFDESQAGDLSSANDEDVDDSPYGVSEEIQTALGNMRSAQQAFRKMYENGDLDNIGFDFIDDVEGGLDNEMFSFTLVENIEGGIAQQDIYMYQGAEYTVEAATTFIGALDAVAHEIYHLEPTNQSMHKSGNRAEMMTAELGAQVKAKQVVRIWRQKYEP